MAMTHKGSSRKMAGAHQARLRIQAIQMLPVEVPRFLEIPAVENAG